MLITKSNINILLSAACMKMLTFDCAQKSAEQIVQLENRNNLPRTMWKRIFASLKTQSKRI